MSEAGLIEKIVSGLAILSMCVSFIFLIIALLTALYNFSIFEVIKTATSLVPLFILIPILYNYTFLNKRYNR